MKKNNQMSTAAVFLVFAATIACGLLSEGAEGLQNALGTAQDFITQQGDLVGTAQAYATQAQESGAVETLQAAATERLGSLQGTAQAFATEHSDEILATAQALATQVSETDFQATLQALATEKGPEARATLQALGTQVAGDPPQDIPVVDGEIFELFSTEFSLTYSTNLERASVISFYKTAMPANGWEIILMGSIEGEQGAFLRFEKDDRRASVGITTNPLSSRTFVNIWLTTE